MFSLHFNNIPEIKENVNFNNIPGIKENIHFDNIPGIKGVSRYLVKKIKCRIHFYSNNLRYLKLGVC